MSCDAYEALDPDEGDPLWNDLHRMADELENALSRLLDAIHEFEKCPQRIRSRNLRIDPQNGNDVDEVYLVPAVYHDSSALLGVEHDTKIIQFIKIFERLLPEEDAPAQWAEIVMLATAWKAEAKSRRTCKR